MADTANALSIAIVGGGVGGLTAAITLRQQGHHITVIEQKQQYLDSNGGGGLSLSLNAIHCLLRLCIDEDLNRIAEQSAQWLIRRHSDGAELSRTPADRWRIFVHRTDLLRVLQRRAAQLGVEFIFGQSFQSLQEDEHGVKAQLSNGVIIEADVVLGADGINSKVRQAIPANKGIHPELTGHRTFLVDVPKQKMEQHRETAELYDLPAFQSWLGANRGIIGWTMRERESYHFQMNDHRVGMGEYRRNGAKDGSTERFTERVTDMPAFRETWKDFEPTIRHLLDAVESCTEWKIAELPEQVHWSDASGRVILIGDAAHAFAPFAGQGACMALEDATALSAMISRMRPPYNWPAVAQAYTRMRQPRIHFIRENIQAIIALCCRPADGESASAPPPAMPLALKHEFDVVQDYDAFEEALKFSDTVRLNGESD